MGGSGYRIGQRLQVGGSGWDRSEAIGLRLRMGAVRGYRWEAHDENGQKVQLDTE